ncbi:eukaryotic translation initiation factor 2B subunit beta [Aphomia sociella]
MSPSEGATKELSEKHDVIVLKLVSDIRSGKLEGSNKIAMATVSCLEQIIADLDNTTAFELSAAVRAAGRRISRALPQQLVAANMVRRVLRFIRDEYSAHANLGGESAGEGLQRLVLAAPARRATLAAAGAGSDLREPIRDQIAELRGELEASRQAVCVQARAHVHADELLLTYGASALAERFLRAAAPRKYKLMLAEGPCIAASHAMAARLSQAGVSVTLIGNASVFAVMSRVNKVVVGARAVLAGGAVLGAAGLHAATSAADHYGVPVIVVAPLYKLSPLHACDQHHFNALAPPHHALPYECSESGSVHVYAPLYDFVPPDHVTLFITNLGGSSPSYIYRLLSELYDPKDHQI